MAATNYANQAQQRVLKALTVIVRHGQAGLTPGEVAVQVGTIPSNATRDLANLIEAGLVERTRSGRFTPGPLLRMVAAVATQQSIAEDDARHAVSTVMPRRRD